MRDEGGGRSTRYSLAAAVIASMSAFIRVRRQVQAQKFFEHISYSCDHRNDEKIVGEIFIAENFS